MPVDTPMPYASRAARFLAQGLDALAAALPFLVVLAVGLVLPDAAIIAPLTLVAAVASTAYWFLADALPGGQSLGKRVLGLAVVHADTREPCTTGQSFVRNLLLAVLGPLDWLFIFGERHQRLGDIVARTIVVAID